MNSPQALPVGQVYANPQQPRKTFPAGPLDELARSIATHGVMQPITVVPRPSDHGTWMVVMGERRLRATLLAKKDEILAIVRDDLNDSQVAELALVENLLREDLSIIEEAQAYQGFLDKGYTVETLGAMLGFNQAWRIQERLNVLKLAPELLEGLRKGAVTASQAQEMSRLSHEGQFRLWRAIQDGKCRDYTALRKMASALFDQENQVELFQAKPMSDSDKEALSKVDQFLSRAIALVGLLTAGDLKVIGSVPKSDARLMAEKLGLVERSCRELKGALLDNAAKQDLIEAPPKKKAAPKKARGGKKK